MKHRMAAALAKEICGPKAFVLLSTNGGKLAYRVCLRGGVHGFNVWSEGKNWDEAIILARHKMMAFREAYEIQEAPRVTSAEGQALLAAKLGDARSSHPGGPVQLYPPQEDVPEVSGDSGVQETGT